MGGRIVSIQLMRALACLLVLFVHLSTFSPFLINRLNGAIGVDIFFIISGFIIAASIERLPVQQTIKTFALNRISRVAPYYYLMTLIYILALLVVGSHLPTVRSLFLSFFFIPTGQDPVQPVGWSLNHEIFFYIFVAICLAFSRNVKVIAFVFFAFFILLHARSSSTPAIREIKASINTEFFFGMLIYVFRDKLVPRFQNVIWFGAAVILVFIAMYLLTDFPVTAQMKALTPANSYLRDTLYFWHYPAIVARGIGWGIPSAILFIAALAQEARLHSLNENNLALKIGNASFTVYLIQHPFFLMLFYFKVSSIALLLIIFSLVIALSLQVYLVESVVAKWTKSQLVRLLPGK